MYKILLLTFKSVNNCAPLYLSESVGYRKAPRNLRSSSQLLLSVPASRLKTFGDRAFCTSAPKLWNTLPMDIRLDNNLSHFKKLLKTFLFKDAFGF